MRSEMANWKTLYSMALLVLLSAVVIPPAIQGDEVIFDDLIVDGSCCIGVDCDEDQEFAFSTLVLDENNLRIFLNDTSITAAFPANDWEIIANDSANGGASYFGIADRGAGLVSFSGGGFCVGGFNEGLECSGISSECFGICNGGSAHGFPCSGAGIDCEDQGGTCEGLGQCLPPGSIVFVIHAGAPENSLMIDSTGAVGLGTDTPTADLDVNGDVRIAGSLIVEGSTGTGVAQICPAKEVMIGIDADGMIICAKKSK